ncbi:MAG: undecaprenyl-diphosphatase UppP [SAR324 cluster bacterium]|nr:undecaprenyl-diphosphatase UppP [SAR324 cluster bacterium]
MTTWFQALVLGIVQGLTEFLPISSTAHLRIVPHLLGWNDPGAAFSAVIQLGTLLSVLIYFRTDILKLLQATLQSIVRKNLLYSDESRMAWGIAVGSIPIVFLGLGFKHYIETDARSLTIIGSALIVLAIGLYASEHFSRQNLPMNRLSIPQIVMVGLFQALALIPGCSRSGSTIMGGLIAGLNRADAARFSFLLGLPAIAGSGLFELKELLESGLGETGMISLLIGIGTSFLVGYLSIEFLLRFLKRYGTLTFVIYRIILGSLILALWT